MAKRGGVEGIRKEANRSVAEEVVVELRRKIERRRVVRGKRCWQGTRDAWKAAARVGFVLCLNTRGISRSPWPSMLQGRRHFAVLGCVASLGPAAMHGRAKPSLPDAMCAGWR